MLQRSQVLDLFRHLLRRRPGSRLGDVMDDVLGKSSSDPKARWLSLSDGALVDMEEALAERLGMMDEHEPLSGLVLLVDGPNALWRNFYVVSSVMPGDSVADHVRSAVLALVQSVRSWVAKHEAAYVLVAWDAGDGGRGALWPAYKAQRADHPEGTEGMIEAARMALRDAGIASHSVDGFEADDLIAAYAKRALGAGLEVGIVSNDKDLRQLVCDRVWVYDASKQARIGAAEVEAKFGVGPALLGDYLALVGDSSDNVPGVPGIGPKTAADLLNQHGSLAGVLAAAPEIKGKRGASLVEHAEQAKLARVLVTLRDDLETMGFEEMKA